MSNYAKKEVKLISKTWGYEKVVVNNEKYCGKILHFVKGHRCSAHVHSIKEETFFLSRGLLEVWFHDDVNELKKFIEEKGEDKIFDKMEKIILDEGEVFHIPPGRVHMMYALKDSDMYEFSSHHEDSDSIRLNKSV